MTITEFKAQVDTQITNQTTDDSITPAFVGGNLKALADIVQAKAPYKQIAVWLDFDGTTITPTYAVNDFSDETITFSNPSNGIIRVAVTNNPLLANKTAVITTGLEKSNVPYFVAPVYDLLPTFLDISIRAEDGTQTSTPLVSKMFIEIRVYD